MLGRYQFNGRGPVQDYPDANKPVRDDLTLGPKFELGSLRAPHSYDGPYCSVPIKAVSRPMPLPQPPRPRQPMQRLPTHNGPQYEQPRHHQQQLQPRPHHTKRSRIVSTSDLLRHHVPTLLNWINDTPPRNLCSRDATKHDASSRSNSEQFNHDKYHLNDVITFSRERWYREPSPEHRYAEAAHEPRYNPYERVFAEEVKMSMTEIPMNVLP